MANLHLARGRRRQIVIDILQHIAAAGFFEANCLDHFYTSLRPFAGLAALLTPLGAQRRGRLDYINRGCCCGCCACCCNWACAWARNCGGKVSAKARSPALVKPSEHWPDWQI